MLPGGRLSLAPADNPIKQLASFIHLNINAAAIRVHAESCSTYAAVTIRGPSKEKEEVVRKEEKGGPFLLSFEAATAVLSCLSAAEEGRGNSAFPFLSWSSQRMRTRRRKKEYVGSTRVRSFF